MSKTVLISIYPKWCELIANGKKTIEVRKTKPKLETPFKCYIYCTKGAPYLTPLLKHGDINKTEIFRADNGKVIGEFVCDEIGVVFDTNGNPQNYMKEVLPSILKNSCMSYLDFQSYANSRADKNNIYGWHISDLVIYNQPKKLSEFGLNRAPQSWCYVKQEG